MGQVVLFLVLVVGPMLLAWFKGDALLDYFATRHRQRQQQLRNRTTRALPIRDVVVKTLLGVESRREQIEGRIGETLATFRQVTENGRALSAHQRATSVLDHLEQVVLSRESLFHDYLDMACLQSDTIETMTQEVLLLREAVQVEQVIQPVGGAATRLLKALEHATQKRNRVDQRLHMLGRA